MGLRYAFFFVECMALLLFALALSESRRRGPVRLMEFIALFFYGLILEEMDMRIFQTYHYGTDFVMNIGKVPVAIALLWAVIVAGAMAITDRVGIPEASKPFMDALVAVWLDLAIDAVAIRLGFWTWKIPLTEGWFGVPAGNLYAWIWVVFFYSFLARVVRLMVQKNPAWRWAALGLPFAAYLMLYFELTLIGQLSRLAGFTTQFQRMFIFWGHLGVFGVISWVSLRDRRPAAEPLAGLWVASRMAIHGFFLIAFFLFGIWRDVPLLGAVAGVVLAVEMTFLKILT